MALIKQFPEPRAPRVWRQSSHLPPPPALPFGHENEEPTVALPDKWIDRWGAYSAGGANTKVSVKPDIGGLETRFGFKRNRSGEVTDSYRCFGLFGTFNFLVIV